MKKLYRDRDYVEASISKSKKIEKRKASHVRRLVNRRRRKLLAEYNAKYSDYKRIIAPPDFSFINNPNEITKFIYKLKQAYESDTKTMVILGSVSTIDYGAVVVLLSVMVKFKTKGIKFEGTLPRNKVAKKMITDSGFFKQLYTSSENNDEYEISRDNGGNICTHAMKNVDPELGNKLITKASEFIWGEKRWCRGVQRSLIELMQNTNNHADINKPGEKHWWLSVSFDKESKKVSFAFVDFGVGIFENLQSNNGKNIFKNITQNIKDKLSFSNNCELLENIFNGKVHKTVTNKDYRGKGLPGIADAAKRNQLSNLHFITNNVHGKVSENSYTTLETSFSGTFVYWELSEDNDSIK